MLIVVHAKNTRAEMRNSNSNASKVAVQRSIGRVQGVIKGILRELEAAVKRHGNKGSKVRTIDIEFDQCRVLLDTVSFASPQMTVKCQPLQKGTAT